MAEKNTLSILESIKQKMVKFDQKEPKSVSSFKGDEFDYKDPETNIFEEEEKLEDSQEPLEEQVEENNQKSAIDFIEEDDHEINVDEVIPTQKENEDFLFENDDEAVAPQESFLHEEENELEDEDTANEVLPEAENTQETLSEDLPEEEAEAPDEDALEDDSLFDEDDDILDLDDDVEEAETNLEEDQPEEESVLDEEESSTTDLDEDFDLFGDDELDDLDAADEEENLDLDEAEDLVSAPAETPQVEENNHEEPSNPEPAKEEIQEPAQMEEDLDVDDDDLLLEDIESTPFESEDPDNALLNDIDLDKEDDLLEEDDTASYPSSIREEAVNKEETDNNFFNPQDTDLEDDLDLQSDEISETEVPTSFASDKSFDLTPEDETDSMEDDLLEEEALPLAENMHFNDDLDDNLSIMPSRTERSEAPLINEQTMQKTTQSIKKLIDANKVVHGMKSFSQNDGAAFSELAVQLMEPKLEKWLNENLPNLVEDIVREEIKKVIPQENPKLESDQDS